jgi:hypothetical protein
LGCKGSEGSSEELSAEELRRRRNQKIRKSREVYATFERHFAANPTWPRDLIDQLALDLGLTPQ